MKKIVIIFMVFDYLNLTVVAEGVETRGQLDLLKDAGCKLVQGYYFSKPIPAEEFARLIEKEIGIERK